MTSNRLYLNSSLQLLLGGILVFFLAYCLHFNVDLSDEGFYLYYFQQGHKAVTFNFYHIFISPIGSLFSHHLIGYRYMSLIFLTGSSIYLYLSMPPDKRKNVWLIPLSLGLMYFNLLSTFSYNTLVLAGSVVVLALLIRFQKSDYKILITTTIGFLCFLIFSARFGSGFIALLLSSIAFFLLTENKREALKYLLFSWGAFLVSFSIYVVFFQENFYLMLETLPAISQSSHLGLLNKYITHTTRFILRSLIPPLVISIVALRSFPKKHQILLLTYLSWFVFKYILFDFNFPWFGYYASGLVLAMAIIELYTKYKKNALTKEMGLFVVLPLAFYFSSSLGTNNNLFHSATYNCLLLYPLVHHLKLSLFRFEAFSFLIFVFCMMGIYNNQYFQTYHSKPRPQQTFVTSRFDALAGIQLDQTIELKLFHLDRKLSEAGFNKQTDRIISYPNLPGLDAYLNLKAYGNPWNIDIYTNSDIYNCAFYKIEHYSANERLFLYAEKPFPFKMAKCLNHPVISLGRGAR